MHTTHTHSPVILGNADSWQHRFSTAPSARLAPQYFIPFIFYLYMILEQNRNQNKSNRAKNTTNPEGHPLRERGRSRKEV